MSEFIFLPGADESANDRLARFNEEFLAAGPLEWTGARAADFKAILTATWLPPIPWKQGGTTCALWLGTAMQAAGVQARRKVNTRYAITTWLKVQGFSGAEWIPESRIAAGEPILRGDIIYWSGGSASTWKVATNGHVGCAIEGSGNVWRMAEGGGSNGRCRLGDAPKDISVHSLRPRRGLWRPNEMLSSIVEKPTVPDGIRATEIPAFIPLKFGDVSTRVGAVQLRLNALGYPLPITFGLVPSKNRTLPQGVPDRGYGGETRGAVAEFQESKGLPVNGKIVDEATWLALFGVTP